MTENRDQAGTEVDEAAHRVAYELGRLGAAADARQDTELTRLLEHFMRAASDYTQAVRRALEVTR